MSDSYLSRDIKYTGPNSGPTEDKRRVEPKRKPSYQGKLALQEVRLRQLHLSIQNFSSDPTITTTSTLEHSPKPTLHLYPRKSVSLSDKISRSLSFIRKASLVDQVVRYIFIVS
jgi:hypothetical protein